MGRPTRHTKEFFKAAAGAAAGAVAAAAAAAVAGATGGAGGEYRWLAGRAKRTVHQPIAVSCQPGVPPKERLLCATAPAAGLPPTLQEAAAALPAAVGSVAAKFEVTAYSELAP